MRFRLASLPNAIISIILAHLAIVQAQQPDSTVTLRDNPVTRLIYFDDSTSVLHHDTVTRDVFRSPDEGKTWQRIDVVPPGVAATVIEHPFDPKTAYILTKEKTHYRTQNRGESWQSFETPEVPAPGSSALSFHAKEWRWVIFTGRTCDSPLFGTRTCTDSSYYTLDGFDSVVKRMLDNTSRCVWAQSTKQFKSDQISPKQIFCVAYEAPLVKSSIDSLAHSVDTITTWQQQSIQDSRLYASDDFFATQHQYIDFGLGRSARGVVGIGSMQGFIVVALKPTASSEEMLFFGSRDGKRWERGIFPHGHGLRENSYTIVDSTGYSILVDVLTNPMANSGTLFTSNSDGTYFIRSLEHTNRNTAGIVDFESLENIDGVAIANILANHDELRGEIGEVRQIQSRITFNDGAKWQPLKPPAHDDQGKEVPCPSGSDCTLHLHSVTAAHNVGATLFSSTAPGMVMGVGNVGPYLKPFEDCDTFLSTNAGVTWTMVEKGPHKYEFGDQGSLLVIVDDSEPTDTVRYSTDFGASWKDFSFGVTIHAKALTTIPDSTSLKFILTGTVSKSDKMRDDEGRHTIVFLDFAPLNKRKCGEQDFEKWYARAPDDSASCLLGHKDWFRRRRPSADCFVGDKFTDPVGREENCDCTDQDYECDFNYVPDPTSGGCVLAGPQQIPAGQCLKEGDTFLGSSGYRKVPGNTCKTVGTPKDAPKQKSCSEGQAAPGQVSHQRFDFPALVLDQSYFADSQTIIAHTSDNHIWQSDNEGFSWKQVQPQEEFLGFTIHPYNKRSAYLVSKERKVTWTPDAGQSWRTFTGPTDQNGMNLPLLDFHPTRPEWIIWAGSENCKDDQSAECKGVAHYSTDSGRNWHFIDNYVRICSWGRDLKFKIDERVIFCEAYRDKKGSQRSAQNNPMQFIRGENYYGKKSVLFDQGVVGFATFEEYMVVAQMQATGSLRMMVSLNGIDFAQAKFPPDMKLENMAYTILESTTSSIFLHVTTQPKTDSAWGVLFKSNSNGTNFAQSLEYANRNDKGYVDFEKMIGLDGIAVINVVSNPQEALITGNKKLQSRITHNDGGKWSSIPPPSRDSLGNPFGCTSTACGLHLHGYTERVDPRATYSSPSAVGLMIAVGSVGMTLAPYADSDTFLTRNGGFSWEEIHKDAHLWEFGDQGSILLLVNDEVPTDHVTYSLNEGLTWQDYQFGDPIKVRSILTVPSDTSRKFILLGYATSNQQSSVAIHLDFSKVSDTKCKFDAANPNQDDFELWSPSEEREEKCLFGRQTFYHRRLRDRNCYIGEILPKPVAKDQKNCTCTVDDFECEFNHVRNNNGECVLVQGLQPLESDPTCTWEQEYWYDRTAYRKIPHSSCEGGLQLDKGTQHLCPHRSRHGFFWWSTVILAPFLFAGLFVFWWMRRKPLAARRGRIRLDDFGDSDNNGPSFADNLAAVPYAIIGVLTAAGAWVAARLPKSRNRSGYRSLALDDDAALLGPEDPDE